MIDLAAIVDTLLLDASYAGVPFWQIDSSVPAGQRAERYLFPGQDATVILQQGQLNDEITVTGLLIGDDYRTQAQAMRTAFRQQGPFTLAHAWLGPLLVVPAKSVEITYTQDELRVARLVMHFWPYAPPPPPTPDTLRSLLTGISSLQQQASQMLAALLLPAALALSAIGAIESFAGTFATFLLSAIPSSAADIIGPLAAAPIAALANVDATPLGSSYGSTIAATLAAPSAAIAGASTPQMTAAVAPGGAITSGPLLPSTANAGVSSGTSAASTVAPPAVDGRITATMLLSVAKSVAALASQPGAYPTIACAITATVLGDAVNAASTIAYTSQQEALGWQQTLDTALAGAGRQAATLAAAQPLLAGVLWRQVQTVRAALAADFAATIGRLPAVQTAQVPQPTSVWALAQYLAGDDPGTVVATYLDLISRNSILNPGFLPAGPVETLA